MPRSLIAGLCGKFVFSLKETARLFSRETMPSSIPTCNGHTRDPTALHSPQQLLYQLLLSEVHNTGYPFFFSSYLVLRLLQYGKRQEDLRLCKASWSHDVGTD